MFKLYEKFQYPQNWPDIKAEIENMLLSANPDYRKLKFVTLSFYTFPLEINPERYPLLNSLYIPTRNRYIAMFFRDLGWIRHSVKSFRNPGYGNT